MIIYIHRWPVCRNIFFSCLLFSQIGCREDYTIPTSEFKYIVPEYQDIKLLTTKDTLHFVLDDSTYTSIKSFNLFVHKGNEYICFYDQLSESVNIYQFASQKFIGKINLKKWLKDRPMYHTSLYVKSFDSIYVANFNKLYLFDRKGKEKGNVSYVDNASAVFDNNTPPKIKNKKLFVLVYPGMDYTSLDQLQKWKTVYEFDISNKIAQLHYNLPAMYHHHLFGSKFIDYNYCLNERGNFVFSFPADTNIYETNLVDFHASYYAKSRFQKEIIRPLTKGQITSDTANKHYRKRDIYGSILFDPYKKRYLRLARQKLTEAAIDAKQLRKQTVIVFNERLKIIGESDLPDDLAFNSIIFSSNRNMYVRVNFKDEQAIHFARLSFTEKSSDSLQQLTKLQAKTIK